MKYLRHSEEHIALEPKRCRVGAPRCSRRGGYGRSSYRCRQRHGVSGRESLAVTGRDTGSAAGSPSLSPAETRGQQPGVPRCHRQRHGVSGRESLAVTGRDTGSAAGGPSLSPAETRGSAAGGPSLSPAETRGSAAEGLLAITRNKYTRSPGQMLPN